MITTLTMAHPFQGLPTRAELEERFETVARQVIERPTYCGTLRLIWHRPACVPVCAKSCNSAISYEKASTQPYCPPAGLRGSCRILNPGVAASWHMLWAVLPQL